MSPLIRSVGLRRGGAFAPPTPPPGDFDETNLFARFRADQGLFTTHDGNTSAAAGDPVGRWEDMTGGGRHLLQPTANRRPTLQSNVVNGHPVLRFDGSNDYLGLLDLSTLTAAEVFLVVKIDADPPGADVQSGLWTVSVGSAAGMDTHYPYVDGVIYDSFGTTARKTTGNPTLALTSWRLYNVTSVADEWTSRIDGAVHFTTVANTVSFRDEAELGRSANAFAPGYYLDGDVAEFIVFSAKCSDAQRGQVEAYVADRYGISIS